MGVVGAAVGTTIGRSTGVVYQLSQMLRRDGRILIEARHLRLDATVMWRLVRLSGSGIFQILISTTSWIGLVRVLAGFGSNVLAGYTIAIRVIVFALLPSWGLSNAAATMVGQALGARKPERAERAVWIACLYNTVVLGVVGAAFMVLSGPIGHIFTTDPQVAPIGVQGLRIISAGFVFYATGMVVSGAGWSGPAGRVHSHNGCFLHARRGERPGVQAGTLEDPHRLESSLESPALTQRVPVNDSGGSRVQ